MQQDNATNNNNTAGFHENTATKRREVTGSLPVFSTRCDAAVDARVLLLCRLICLVAVKRCYFPTARENDICSHQTRSMGSKYTTNAFTYLCI